MSEKLTYEELEAKVRDLEHEIVKHKSAQKKLEKSDDRQTSLVNAISEAGIWLFIVDKEYCVRYMNELMIKSFGNAIGKTCYRDVKGNDFPCSYCPLAEVIDNGKMVNYESKLADGRIFAVTSVPYTDIDGTLCKLEIIRDITDSKLIETQLQQAQKMESIGTLAGGIAHDFNNILSGIFGYSQLAQSHLEDPERANQDIEQIFQGAKRAADLVQQILTFSRKTKYQKHLLKIYMAVNDALKLLRASIPSSIEIVKKLDSKSLIYADPIRIHQIVMNLCTNSYQSMRKTGGSLTVSLTDVAVLESKYLWDKKIIPGEYLKLEISDTGLGMDKNELDKAFEPYFTTKGLGEGTGLGLALVHAIVDEHDSFLDIYSKPGKGTSFSIYFPIIKAIVNDDSFKALKEYQTKGNERVMVVDDEEAIRQSHCVYLQSQGYQVDTFSNGMDALKEFKADSRKFNLIITDMTMPELTGDKFAEKILKIEPQMPIILCTGYSDTMTENRAKTLGIKKFVQKPISNQELVVLIREILDKCPSS